MTEFNINPNNQFIPGATPLVEGLGDYVQHSPFGPPAFVAAEGTIGAKPVRFFGPPPEYPHAHMPPGIIDQLARSQESRVDAGLSELPGKSARPDPVPPAGTDSLLEDAKREVAREQQAVAFRRQEEEGVRHRTAEGLAQAQIRLQKAYAQIPELYRLLLEARHPASHFEGEWRSGIRSFMALSVHPTIVQKAQGRRCWPLASVQLTGRRRVVTSSNPKFGDTHGWRDVPIGEQGVALVDDGQVYEFSKLDDNRSLVTGETCDIKAKLPPLFVRDQNINAGRGLSPDERLTFIVNKWATEIEGSVKSLAKECYRRLGRPL